jgi:hypothetical protein
MIGTKLLRKISNIYISDLVHKRTIYPITSPESTNKFLGGGGGGRGSEAAYLCFI